MYSFNRLIIYRIKEYAQNCKLAVMPELFIHNAHIFLFNSSLNVYFYCKLHIVDTTIYRTLSSYCRKVVFTTI